MSSGGFAAQPGGGAEEPVKANGWLWDGQEWVPDPEYMAATYGDAGFAQGGGDTSTDHGFPQQFDHAAHSGPSGALHGGTPAPPPTQTAAVVGVPVWAEMVDPRAGDADVGKWIASQGFELLNVTREGEVRIVVVPTILAAVDLCSTLCGSDFRGRPIHLAMHRQGSPTGHDVFVAGVPPTCRERDVFDAFASSYSSLVAVKLERDMAAPRLPPTGVALVRFGDPQEAQDALRRMHSVNIGGGRCLVTQEPPRPAPVVQAASPPPRAPAPANAGTVQLAAQGIAPGTTEKALFEFVDHFIPGGVRNVLISGQRGRAGALLGTVTVVNGAAARDAIARVNGKALNGVQVHFTPANAVAEHRGEWGPASPPPPAAGVGTKEPAVCVLRLAPDVGDKELFDFFHEAVPGVMSASVKLDTVTGVSRCYGFVRMDSLEHAKGAMAKMDYARLHARRIRVRPAKGSGIPIDGPVPKDVFRLHMRGMPSSWTQDTLFDRLQGLQSLSVVSFSKESGPGRTAFVHFLDRTEMLRVLYDHNGLSVGPGPPLQVGCKDRSHMGPPPPGYVPKPGTAFAAAQQPQPPTSAPPPVHTQQAPQPTPVVDAEAEAAALFDEDEDTPNASPASSPPPAAPAAAASQPPAAPAAAAAAAGGGDKQHQQLDARAFVNCIPSGWGQHDLLAAFNDRVEGAVSATVSRSGGAGQPNHGMVKFGTLEQRDEAVDLMHALPVSPDLALSVKAKSGLRSTAHVLHLEGVVSGCRWEHLFSFLSKAMNDDTPGMGKLVVGLQGLFANRSRPVRALFKSAAGVKLARRLLPRLQFRGQQLREVSDPGPAQQRAPPQSTTRTTSGVVFKRRGGREGEGEGGRPPMPHGNFTVHVSGRGQKRPRGPAGGPPAHPPPAGGPGGKAPRYQ